MRRTLRTVGAMLIGLLAVPASGALLVNPSFEQPTVGNPDFNYYFAGSPAITGWTIIGSSVDLLSTNWKAQEGKQSIDLNGLDRGGLYQDVVTEPGKQYHLSFWIAGNPELQDSPGTGPKVKKLNLSWAGQPVSTLSFDVTGKVKTDPGWTMYSYDLIATNPLTRLQFEGATNGTAGILLDNVSLNVAPAPVPLPPAAFIGVIGAAAAGAARRRWK